MASDSLRVSVFSFDVRQEEVAGYLHGDGRGAFLGAAGYQF